MLFKLLGLPVTLPAAGIKFCLQQVLNAAEAELGDPAPVKEELLNLQLQLEEGEITEEEYVEREAVLMRRLREIRAYRQRKAQEQRDRMAASAVGGLARPQGAVVEFTADAPPPNRAASAPPSPAVAPPLAGGRRGT
jgi:Gas vesicle protein G